MGCGVWVVWGLWVVIKFCLSCVLTWSIVWATFRRNGLDFGGPILNESHKLIYMGIVNDLGSSLLAYGCGIYRPWAYLISEKFLPRAKPNTYHVFFMPCLYINVATWALPATSQEVQWTFFYLFLKMYLTTKQLISEENEKGKKKNKKELPWFHLPILAKNKRLRQTFFFMFFNLLKYILNFSFFPDSFRWCLKRKP